MPENFQEEHTRRAEDANEAFEELIQSMKDVVGQIAYIETNLQSSLNSFQWACARGPIRHAQI